MRPQLVCTRALTCVLVANVSGCCVCQPVMGVVVLAVGTSIPDALGSMIVARQGEADMAIANAVGSNVFDILLGLGLPWFLSYFVHDAPTLVNVSGIGTSLAILYGTVFLFLGVIAVNKFRFNSKLGYIFFSMYLLYLTYVPTSRPVVALHNRQCTHQFRFRSRCTDTLCWLSTV